MERRGKDKFKSEFLNDKGLKKQKANVEETFRERISNNVKKEYELDDNAETQENKFSEELFTVNRNGLNANEIVFVNVEGPINIKNDIESTNLSISGSKGEDGNLYRNCQPISPEERRVSTTNSTSLNDPGGGGDIGFTRIKGILPYVCNHCGYRCQQKSYIVIHLRTHTGEKPFACNQCDFRTAHKKNLKAHARTHDNKSAHKRILRDDSGFKSYACHHCNFRTARKITLKVHAKVHSGLKPFACTQCDYTTAHKAVLKRHMKAHSGLKPYACNYCDYKSAFEISLKNHILSHSATKPLACSDCSYRGVYLSNFKAHMRIHTGEKPFECHHCRYRSIHKSHLKRHILHVHSRF